VPIASWRPAEGPGSKILGLSGIDPEKYAMIQVNARQAQTFDEDVRGPQAACRSI
jgi:hypothetical protein